MGGNPKVIMTDGEGAIKNSGLFHKYFYGTQYYICTIKGPSCVRRKDDQDVQGDVRQADQARRTVGRLDMSNTINV